MMTYMVEGPNDTRHWWYTSDRASKTGVTSRRSARGRLGVCI